MPPGAVRRTVGADRPRSEDDPMPDPRPLSLAVPRERAPGERRVALLPDTVGQLVAQGLPVLVEPGAGQGARVPDAAYAEAGATLGDAVWEAGIVVCVRAP